MGSPTPEADTGDDTGPGGTLLGGPGTVLVTILLLALTLVTLVAIVVFWPADDGSGVTGRVAGLDIELDRTRANFLVVALSGCLGGTIHAVRSLYWYVGNRAFRRSWLAFYLCVPLVGAALSTVFYLAFRGGLFSGQSGAADVNIYGFGAVSALVGLFSAQAIAKLKEVFSSLFAPAEKGDDHVPPQ